MAVKIGDIVSYEGNDYRVMKRFSQTVCISGKNGNHCAPVSDVTIIKSTILPNIKLGDDVIIHDIPQHERNEEMDGVWVCEMDEFIGGVYTVQKTWYHDEYGPLVKLNGYWFQTYHLELVNNYDMI